MFSIWYGYNKSSVDVTTIALNKCVKQNIMRIQASDHERAKLFTDPFPNILKSIYIQINATGQITEYDHLKNVYLDLTTLQIYTDANIPAAISEIYPNFVNKLHGMQTNLKLAFGSFQEEYPEQLMAVRYLTGTEKVLEIGGNIGRNSLIIGSILNQRQNKNFVTLESDKDIALQLTYNKEANNLAFQIENSALSNRKLIQSGWNTIVSDTLLDGYKSVKTISWSELNAKYQIEFDTLVLDCEGAFYYILIDMPEILTNIKLIIMENDYVDIGHKQYIDRILRENNFQVDYSESGGWGCCYQNFYEVWKKHDNINI